MGQDLYYRVFLEAAGAGYDLSSHVTSLTVEEASGKADELTFKLSDPYKVYSHAVKRGVGLEVDIGSVDDHSVVFRGSVHKVDGDFPQDGVPTLQVQAYDRSMRMGIRKRNRHWNDNSLANIVYAVGKEYFLVQDIHVALNGDHEVSRNGVRQQNETDLAFLLRLAAKHMCEMFVVAGTHWDEMHFEAQSHIMAKDPILALYYQRCGAPNRLLSFKPNSNVSRMQPSRSFCGVDYAKGKRLVQEKQEPGKGAKVEDRAFKENLAAFQKEFPIKAKEFEAFVEAVGGEEEVEESLRKELGGVEPEITSCFTTQKDLAVRRDNPSCTTVHGMQASGLTDGNHRIHAQATIEIVDVGSTFSGIWYLSNVRHVFDGQGYRVEFECQR